MKTHAPRVTLCAAFAALSLTNARADNYYFWTPTDGASWNNTANWQYGEYENQSGWVGNVIPGGAGSLVQFLNPGTATYLDAPFTVGCVYMNTENNNSLNTGSGGSLTFDNGVDGPLFCMWGNDVAGREVYVYAPLHGENGLRVYTTGARANWRLYNAGTLSGDLVISNNVWCWAYANNVLGASRLNLEPGSRFMVAGGCAVTNDITAAGVFIQSTSRNANNNLVTFSGNITLTGSDSIYAGEEGSPPVTFNGPITGTNPNGCITFRASNASATGTPITFNAPVSLNGASLGANSDAVLVHTGARLVVNAPFTWQGGRFRFQAGFIICGAAHVFDTAQSMYLDSNNETTWGQEFNLNGFDQRVGGFYGGANGGAPTLRSHITTTAPATLTLDIPSGSGGLGNKSYFDGALTVFKTGEGTQSLTSSSMPNLIDKWVVEDGALQFGGGAYSASAEVCGGKLFGSGTLVFRVNGDTMDQLIMTDGELDLSGFNAAFDVQDMPSYGDHLILDATAGGTFTPASADPKLPFLSVSGELPEGLKLKAGANLKQVWLTRPLPGTLLLLR